MHYGEFAADYFISLADMERRREMSDSRDAKPTPVEGAFSVPFALALSALSLVTIVFALLQV